MMNRISKLLILALLVNVQFLHGQTISKSEYKETATEESWTIGSETSSNYYVSATNGSPNGDGSRDNPWDSLDDIDAYTFSPGDSVLFERGSK